MAEALNRVDHPEHFDVHHENGETLMCMSSGSECRVMVEVMAGYTPQEEQQLIVSATSALKAIDRYTGYKAADIFTGLLIKIGEDVAEGGAQALAEENKIVLNGRKMLLSIAEMRHVSDAYSDDELAGFPGDHRPGGALEYTLVHEIGHVLDGQTKSGAAYHRVAADESPTRYGREADEWHSDNKDHEAFADGFAHAVYSMPVSETMTAVVRDTLSARLREMIEMPNNFYEVDTQSVAESANYQGNWLNLQFERVSSRDFKIKFERFIMQHTGSLKPGRPQTMLDKPDDFQSHYQKQLDNFNDTATRVHTVVGYGAARDVGGVSPRNLGHGKIGAAGTVYGDATDRHGTSLLDRQKDIIAAHEAFHGIINVKGSAVAVVQSGFDWAAYDAIVDKGGINQPDYLRNPDELVARMAQFKNYFGMGSNESFTNVHLEYVRQHYVEDTGLDNGITTMLSVITQETEEQFIHLMNELPI